MILRSFMSDLVTQEVNSYLIADETTRRGALVDAGGFEPQIPATAAELGLEITHILLTHLHWDHVDALPHYLEVWPEAMVVAPAPPPTPCPRLSLVGPGDRFAVGRLEFEVFQTSGHTPESVSYYCRAAGVCFVGDALFAGAVGGTADEAAYNEQLGHLKAAILTLPESTEILPGHGPLTTVEVEKAANPFLQPGWRRQG